MFFVLITSYGLWNLKLLLKNFPITIPSEIIFNRLGYKINMRSFYSGQSHLFSLKYRLAQAYTPAYLQCPNLHKKGAWLHSYE